MKKLISFSIWGDNPMYSDGMMENISLAPIVYPDWVVRVYLDESVPSEVVSKLQSTGAEVVVTPPLTNNRRRKWEGLFWRFCPVSDENIDVVIVRDADSRLNSREKAAVDEWLASEKGFHTMRDHWNHNVPVMGGMWGCRKGVFPQMESRIREWLEFNIKGTDQTFLQQVVWDSVRMNTLAHDKFNFGFLKLPNGELLRSEEIAIYNKEDNCGGSDYSYPRGKIVLRDGRIFQRLDVYYYSPTDLFGTHEVRPFPPHDPMQHGRYVGESSQDFHKPYNTETDSYIG